MNWIWKGSHTHSCEPNVGLKESKGYNLQNLSSPLESGACLHMEWPLDKNNLCEVVQSSGLNPPLSESTSTHTSFAKYRFFAIFAFVCLVWKQSVNEIYSVKWSSFWFHLTCIYQFTDICQFRLDFDTFVLGVASNVCTDSFDVVSPTNSNGLSTLCGKLTGQHCKY